MNFSKTIIKWNGTYPFICLPHVNLLKITLEIFNKHILEVVLLTPLKMDRGIIVKYYKMLNYHIAMEIQLIVQNNFMQLILFIHYNFDCERTFSSYKTIVKSG